MTLSSDSLQTLPRARAGFVLILTGVMLMMAGASAPSLFYPVLQQEMGFAPATISLIFSIYAAGLLVTLLTAGSVSDHVGRRPVISVGFLALALAAYLFWHAGNVPQLLVARALQGIATGLLMPSLSRARKELKELEEEYELYVDPDKRIDEIGVGMQQRVEILKALYRKAEILILDEPTGVLTPAEADQLFRILDRLR